MITIPKTFELAALIITTSIDKTLCSERKIAAEACYPSQSIVLDPTIHQPASVVQNFYHEKVHWILYVMNRHDLRTDEAFVDVFAHLLYQSDLSAKGNVFGETAPIFPKFVVTDAKLLI